MEYGKTSQLFKLMQKSKVNEEYNINKYLPQLTIGKAHLELMNLITEELKDNGFTIDKSGLKNYRKDQPLKIIFNKDKTPEYELYVKHTGENIFSEVAMYIEGGEYNGNKPYTVQNAWQKITEIIKNN